MVKQIQQSNKMGQVRVSFSSTIFIRINAPAFTKFLALIKMRRLFEVGVYSRAAFIANLVTKTVNLLFHLNVCYTY